jgi:hypothetical protein
MVREIPEVYLEEVEEDSSARRDVSETGGFVKLDVSNGDLIEAFQRFVSSSRGSFNTLLEKWVNFRLEADLPVDFTQPECKQVSQQWRADLQAAFNRVRKKKA